MLLFLANLLKLIPAFVLHRTASAPQTRSVICTLRWQPSESAHHDHCARPNLFGHPHGHLRPIVLRLPDSGSAMAHRRRP